MSTSMQQFTISASWQLSGTPLEKNLYRASDATMNSRTSLLIRKGTFLPLNGLCGHGRDVPSRRTSCCHRGSSSSRLTAVID